MPNFFVVNHKKYGIMNIYHPKTGFIPTKEVKMKIRVFILIVAAAFMLSSCGKTPESDIVQTNPDNDIPAVTTAEESTADNIDTIDDGEDIYFFDDGKQ